jgi:hypothetical protein
MKLIEGEVYSLNYVPIEIRNRVSEIAGNYKDHGVELDLSQTKVRYDGLTFNQTCLEVWFTVQHKGEFLTSFVSLYKKFEIQGNI